MTAVELLSMLQVRYSPPEWAFLSQVRNGTGWSKPKTRTADALAFNLWPSRGLELHGFEIKAYRGDWIRELKDPAKADEISGYCDRWWVVVADKDLVQPGELPPTWGFLAPRGNRLVAITEAPKLEAKSLDRSFIAAALRRASETMVAVELVDKAVAAGVAKEAEADRARLAGELADAEELRERVRVFEEWSGLSLHAHGWPYHGPEKLGRAVRQVLDSDPEKIRREIEFIRDRAAQIVQDCNETLNVKSEEAAA